MADIDLQKKRNRSIWPWILGALVAILAIWALVQAFDDDEPMTADVDQPAVIEPAPGVAAEMGTTGEGLEGAIADFRQRCVDTTSEEDMGLQHQWTIQCLESLAAAMDNAIRSDTIGDVALQERLNTLRERATEVRESDPSAMSHAATVDEAFDAGAELVRTYQEERTTGQAQYADQVQQAADRLSGDQPLLEQRDAVHGYFRAIGDALQQMSTR